MSADKDVELSNRIEAEVIKPALREWKESNPDWPIRDLDGNPRVEIEGDSLTFCARVFEDRLVIDPYPEKSAAIWPAIDVEIASDLRGALLALRGKFDTWIEGYLKGLMKRKSQ